MRSEKIIVRDPSAKFRWDKIKIISFKAYDYVF